MKLLIAEDLDIINTGIVTLLKANFDFDIVQTNSCDTAFLKLQHAQLNESPFDLLISDLSFKTLGVLDPQLESGLELIRKAKEIQPSLKTIVYSIEEKPILLKTLIEDLRIDAYILKGLESLNQLLVAIKKVKEGETFFPIEVLHILKSESPIEISDYDISLLSLLAEGLSQVDISEQFKVNSIIPSSTSAIEKKINFLKTTFKAKNNVHMVAIAKDLGIL